MADDLLGEVWARAFAARATYDPNYADARPWLYGIARNVLRAHWRAERGVGRQAAEEELDPWDGLVASSIIVRSFRQLYCPAPLLGRLTASMSTVAYSAIPLGAFLAGTLGTWLGSRDALWVMTGALAASATILLVGPIRRHRELPIEPPALLAPSNLAGPFTV